MIKSINQLAVKVKDFPKKGVDFWDLTPVYEDYNAFASISSIVRYHCMGKSFNGVIGLDARGFILAASIAHGLAPLILARKPGKLPRETYRQEYLLEYGKSELEINKESLKMGKKYLIVDDILATGGTAGAAGRIVERAGAEVAGFAFLGEIEGLGGRALLATEFPNAMVYAYCTL